jgi:hypothetical protein
MQFGRVDPLQTNALSAQFDGVTVSNAHRRGICAYGEKRRAKERQHDRQPGNREERFHADQREADAFSGAGPPASVVVTA